MGSAESRSNPRSNRSHISDDLVTISATGRSRVEFDVRDFYHNESRILGADSRKRDASASAKLLTAMLPAFESGALSAPPIDEVVPLDGAVDAYQRVAAGARDRFVLAPWIRTGYEEPDRVRPRRHAREEQICAR